MSLKKKMVAAGIGFSLGLSAFGFSQVSAAAEGMTEDDGQSNLEQVTEDDGEYANLEEMTEDGMAPEPAGEVEDLAPGERPAPAYLYQGAHSMG